MEIITTAIPDVLLVRPPCHEDDRGLFSETYNRRLFEKAGIINDFVQDNHVVSARRGTLRGLHFQRPPHAQAKLVRVLHGSVVDVAVDLRHGSPTFGQHVLAELSAGNWLQMLVPRGFAHAVLTLEPDTVVTYKVDAYWASGEDGGVAWDDPDLDIAWPLAPAEIVLSGRDASLPRLRELPVIFAGS